MKTAAIIAVAGLASAAAAQSATVSLTHNDGDSTINVGETVTWTLSVAFTGGEVVSGVNMAILGDNALGTSSAMTYTGTNGGNNGGDFSSTKFPARYEVDYIRVYQKED